MNRPIRDTIKLMAGNWKNLSLIVTFDILFVLLLINLRFLLVNFNTWAFGFLYKAGAAAQYLLSILLMIIILFLVTSVYAFFKYLIVKHVEAMFKKPKIMLGRLFIFLKLNWLILTPTLLIFVGYITVSTNYLGGLVTSGLNNPRTFLFVSLAIFAAAFLLFIYSYTLLNLSHSMFLKERRLKKMIKQAFTDSFKSKSYKIYWNDFKIILLFLIVLLVIHIFMRVFVLAEFSTYLRYYGLYKGTLLTLAAIVGYFLVLFNRINFYTNYRK